MANRAYLRVWTRDFSEQTMIAEFARFLTTAPVPERPNGFQMLTVQPVDYTIPSEVEWDLRDAKYGPAEIAALAIQDLNADTAFVVEAKWELWNFDIETLKWENGPQPLTLICQGTAFEDGAAATSWRIWDLSICSRGTRDCWRRGRHRIRLRVRTILWRKGFARGWEAGRT
jgi:hypothetical protein